MMYMFICIETSFKHLNDHLCEHLPGHRLEDLLRTHYRSSSQTLYRKDLVDTPCASLLSTAAKVFAEVFANVFANVVAKALAKVYANAIWVRFFLLC